jgi:hypothetical protein
LAPLFLIVSFSPKQQSYKAQIETTCLKVFLHKGESAMTAGLHKSMTLYFALIIISTFLFGCSNRIVNIISEPSGADVFSNRDRIGKTPLLTSTDEILPLWSSDGVFTRAVITIRKPGFEDYKEFVNELTMPDLISATLIPLQSEQQKTK